MAEQLGSAVALAQGAAVDRHKQPRALTLAMDMPGQQLLAGAGLAADQQRLHALGQYLNFIAQAPRTRVNEHQRTGTNA